MADLVAARDRIEAIATSWTVDMHGVLAVYPAPPNNYQRILTPSVVIANVGLPAVSYYGGTIDATYALSVDWLFGAHEASAFGAAIEALPMMVEDLATDADLTTICTGNLSVAGADPTVGLFEFDGKQFFAARVIVNCGFIDTVSIGTP